MEIGQGEQGIRHFQKPTTVPLVNIKLGRYYDAGISPL